MDDALQIENLSLSLNGNTILDDISLTLKRGAFAALCGRNGAGKSQLLRCIKGLRKPEGGRILIDGEESDAKTRMKKIAIVFQNAEMQIVSQSVEKDVAFGPENMGLEKEEVERRVEAALSAMGLKDKAKQRPQTLSGGELRKCAIAGILAMEPDVIRNAAFIACGSRVTPWLTAHNEAQRMALEADRTFRRCESLKGGAEGLKAARAMALISYRSYEGYNATQSEQDVDTLFADRAASYERYQGKKLADRFDAYSYWYITYSVDSHNVGRGRGGVAAALGSVKSRSIVIGIDSDDLFPVEEQRYIAECIPGAEYHEITSRFGHDGFLLEYSQIAGILAPVIED